MRFLIRKDTGRDLDEVVEYLVKKLQLEMGPYEIKISKYREKRSIDQNSLYWLWLTCISEETGNDKEDLHSYFKERYLDRHIVRFGRNYKSCSPSTGALDTAQFTDYLRCIERDMAECGIVLVSPNNPEFPNFLYKYRNKVG
jgi:hypothetical protein